MTESQVADIKGTEVIKENPTAEELSFNLQLLDVFRKPWFTLKGKVSFVPLFRRAL